ncbi:zinc finger C2H2 domain-containing protein [Candidatus Nitrososphaera gargensis Ga9.2]|uniref:Zinc finger C2H2 domain-containing protein n=1 Tax=Nitrososphaera gargensis (strain Ga9.2) TaxID=1237085 RepID=K0IL71_NITGG|nr:zinc finger C2H2 domain-containing protein [Candidatus Nitrososphaera gargensis Ga9.2]
MPTTVREMFGFTIYLMHLADYLQGRKDRTCPICKRRFDTFKEMDIHRQKEH